MEGYGYKYWPRGIVFLPKVGLKMCIPIFRWADILMDLCVLSIVDASTSFRILSLLYMVTIAVFLQDNISSKLLRISIVYRTNSLIFQDLDNDERSSRNVDRSYRIDARSELATIVLCELVIH